MADFTASIQVWYRQSKRALPWRENKNPYYVWLSEIMCQQTRVDQASNYFLAFKKAFPQVTDLANADEDKVMRMWQGLGYYSRARNLHATAKIITSEFGGIFPKEYNDILALKGIGEYTASAISSISFNLPHAVVDGNVYRVLSRYYGIELPIDSAKGKKHFKTLANELLDRKNPGEYNQAVMEFGALQCVPKSPVCDNCPLKDSCCALSDKKIALLPIKEKKTKTKNRYLDYFVITDGKKLLVKKRDKKDIWQGLYDFPCRDSFKKLPPPEDEINTFNPKNYFLDYQAKHILSHQIIYANFWVTKVNGIQNSDYGSVTIKNLFDLPKPQLLVKYLSSSPYFNNL